MHGFPSDLDPAVFCGRELQLVSFTSNTVHLSFDGDASITADSTVLYQVDDASALVQQVPPVAASALMALVGRRVCAATSNTDGSLRLQLEGGGIITCLDDSKDYESYHVRVGGQEFHV